jgi:hypothetical protein
MIDSYGRPREQPFIPQEHLLVTTSEVRARVVAVNAEIRDAAFKTQAIDKGFDPFIRHFHQGVPMDSCINVIPGVSGNHGWSVCSQQNRHRCLLTGRTYGHAYEDVVGEALSVWPNCEPSPGKMKAFPGTYYYPVEFAYEMEVFDRQDIRISAGEDAGVLVLSQEICQRTSVPSLG